MTQGRAAAGLPGFATSVVTVALGLFLGGYVLTKSMRVLLSDRDGVSKVTAASLGLFGAAMLAVTLLAMMSLLTARGMIRKYLVMHHADLAGPVNVRPMPAPPASDIPALARTRTRLAELGFTEIGAWERTTPFGDARALIAADADGTVANVQLGTAPMPLFARLAAGRMSRGPLVILRTELSDGTLVSTMVGAPFTVAAPFADRRIVTGGDVGAQVEAHRARVAEHRAKGAEPVPTRSFRDVEDLDERTRRRVVAFRREIGWLTREEIQRLGALTGAKFVEAEKRRLERELGDPVA